MYPELIAQAVNSCQFSTVSSDVSQYEIKLVVLFTVVHPKSETHNSQTLYPTIFFYIFGGNTLMG